jgi:hypothetical protein
MQRETGTELSEELAALFIRAEAAKQQAFRLLEENDRWRQRVLAQFDYMFHAYPVDTHTYLLYK